MIDIAKKGYAGTVVILLDVAELTHPDPPRVVRGERERLRVKGVRVKGQG